MKRELRKRQAKRGGMCGCEESLTRPKLDVVQLAERRIWDAEAVSLSLTIQTSRMMRQVFMLWLSFQV